MLPNGKMGPKGSCIERSHMTNAAKKASGVVKAKYSGKDINTLATTEDAQRSHLNRKTAGIIQLSALPVEVLSATALETAWATLWVPMAEFPLLTASDRGAVAAAVFTAAMRKWLPTAPGFAFTGDVPASGKTLLATCIVELAGGNVALIPECGIASAQLDQALRLRLMTALQDGCHAVLLDNVRSPLKSSTLEELLTVESLTDKVLSTTGSLSVRTNVMMLISGNFNADWELQRRFITAQFAPRDPHPERRCYKHRPRWYCRTHREQIVTAALTILGGYVAAGAPRISAGRHFPGFHCWDELIRQCVLWLTRIGVAGLGDPVTAGIPG